MQGTWCWLSAAPSPEATCGGRVQANLTTRERDGGLVINFGQPGGDLLVKLETPCATTLLPTEANST